MSLKPNQIPHYWRLLNILSRFKFYLDGSETGAGKTYPAIAVALYLGLPVLVVGPKSARAPWRRVLSMAGVPTVHLPGTEGIITYDTLRSTTGHQPIHGLLRRMDLEGTVVFYPTEMLLALIDHGVFFIFDEAQKLKNLTDQHYAVRAIVREVQNRNTISRVGFLSASLGDKPEHVVNLMTLLGFVEQSRSGRIKSVDELIQFGGYADPEATSRFLLKEPQELSEEFVYRFFLQIVRPNVMSTIARALTTAVKDIKNGHYRLTEEDWEKYRLAVAHLRKAIRKGRGEEVEIEGEVVEVGTHPVGLTPIMIELQEAKMRAMARVGRERLMENEKNKVILFADYYVVVDYLMNELAEYHPVELTGRVEEGRRAENVRLFQEESERVRLLIGNPKVGGLSVSLHDITGEYPRFMYIMPGYNVNDLHQATGRVFREGTKGVATIRFFYGPGEFREERILSTIMRKGMVLREIHEEQAEYGVVFPDEYEDEYE